MNTFDAIYDKLTGGAVGNWLAIIGVLSLIYWAWRIVAALQRSGPIVPMRDRMIATTTGPPASPSPSGAGMPGT